MLLISAIAWVLGVGCCLSFNPDCAEALSVAGISLFDLFDKATSNYLMPLGGLLVSLFVGWKMNRKVLHDTLTNFGKDAAPYESLFLFAVRFFAPVCILLIFLAGLGVFS